MGKSYNNIYNEETVSVKFSSSKKSFYGRLYNKVFFINT